MGGRARRMRPDQSLVGEICRGKASSFLRAVNPGHPGLMTMCMPIARAANSRSAPARRAGAPRPSQAG
ncbi:MAG: Flp pilus assembly complex ATPase component TadA, partial [Proteobacteria bacterium]|nr:Flp pilus assembly complex ATPase component TadA [Pseudomonadota bacterium]